MPSQDLPGTMQRVEEGTHSEAVEEPDQEAHPGSGNPEGASAALVSLGSFRFILHVMKGNSVEVYRSAEFAHRDLTH